MNLFGSIKWVKTDRKCSNNIVNHLGQHVDSNLHPTYVDNSGFKFSKWGKFAW